MPLRVEMPKVASEPVSEPTSPMRIVSPVTPGVPPEAGAAAVPPDGADGGGGAEVFFSQPTRARAQVVNTAARAERMGTS